MKSGTSILGLVIILVLSWSLPIYSVIRNQLHPDYGSALGVAFGFGIGCVIHLILLLIWIAVRKSQLPKIHLFVLLISFVLLIALAVISNGGTFSRTIG